MSVLSRTLLVLACGCMIVFMTGCPEESADQRAARQTSAMQGEASRQIGMPNIVNWQEMKLMKRIYELRDQERLNTYTYVFALDGTPVFLTRSLGYGLPYSTQFTNPEKSYNVNYTMPQPEPNGLFMPESAEATWVVAVDDSGKEHVMYIEERVMITSFVLPQAKYPAGKPGGN